MVEKIESLRTRRSKHQLSALLSIAQVSEKWAFIVFLKCVLLIAIIIFTGRSELYNVSKVKNPGVNGLVVICNSIMS